MFAEMNRSELKMVTYADDKFGDNDFKVSMNETNWEFDENNVLKSALCFIGDNRTFLPVTWDNKGAYVENNGTKKYILEYCE